MAFDPVSVTGYNANPPEDDGTEVPTNEVTWAGIKTKLNDPVKTAFDALVTELTTTFDELFDILMAPSGTRMLFHQTTPPTGWTKDTTRNDKALRVVSGTVGEDGGTTAFSSVFAARTILKANLPSYNLVVTDTRTFQFTHRNDGATQNVSEGGEVAADNANETQTIDMASPTTGTIVAALGGSGTAMDFAVQRVDVTIGEKD